MNIRQQIPIKSPDELEILREAGKILAAVRNEIACSLKAGMTTAQIDELAETLIEAKHVRPAFKGYHGFPACACVSVNQEVVHGIPGDKVIQEGDLVSVDLGVIHKGYYSDTAVTVGVGKVKEPLKRLMEVTRQALAQGIAHAKAKNHLSDISHAVQSFVETRGYSVVRDFVGHGIGKELHEPPEIPNFGSPHCGPVLKTGMVLAIEPMVNIGTWQTRILDNGWTVETGDGKCSAHFEHSVEVTESGPRILTE